MELVIAAILFVLVFISGWMLGGIHVYNQEIKVLNGFRKRVEDIEAKYRASQQEQVKHEEN